MPANVVKTKKDEEKWKKAKEAFKKSYDKDPSEDKDWAIVMSIYKKMTEDVKIERYTPKFKEAVLGEYKKRYTPYYSGGEESFLVDYVMDLGNHLSVFITPINDLKVKEKKLIKESARDIKILTKELDDLGIRYTTYETIGLKNKKNNPQESEIITTMTIYSGSPEVLRLLGRYGYREV
jgi:hypothetical protein